MLPAGEEVEPDLPLPQAQIQADSRWTRSFARIHIENAVGAKIGRFNADEKALQSLLTRELDRCIQLCRRRRTKLNPTPGQLLAGHFAVKRYHEHDIRITRLSFFQELDAGHLYRVAVAAHENCECQPCTQ